MFLKRLYKNQGFKKKHNLTFSYPKFKASVLALVHGNIFFSGGIFLQIAHNKWVWWPLETKFQVLCEANSSYGQRTFNSPNSLQYLSMKQGSLFCFICHAEVFSNHVTSCRALSIFRKLSMSRGALSWFEIVWSYSVEAYWLLNHFVNEN
jgi:hypothetical protein